jgi:hypothetical protein
VPKVTAGQPFLVDAAIQNTGDKAGSDTLINFVVPDCFELRQRRKPEEEPLVAANDTAGLPPDNRVLFFAPRPDPWIPVNWFVCQYRLRYIAADQLEEPLRVRLLFDISDSRFNSRGRRWLPSIVPTLELQGPPVASPWPAAPSPPDDPMGPSRAARAGGMPAGQPQGCPRPHRAASGRRLHPRR